MIDTSKIYSSNNCGDFKVAKYVNASEIHVEFLLTGYKVITCSSNLKKGVVKDRLYPNVKGIGYVGEGNHRPSMNGRDSKQYTIWASMIARCYCSKAQKRNPTYIGVAVCDEWHNFQNFAEWFEYNYIEGFDMDKDVRQRGVKNKIYSPETCIFISRKDNNVESHAQNYIMADPTGKVHEIYNMREFCQGKDLNDRHMTATFRGQASQHKGWTKA